MIAENHLSLLVVDDEAEIRSGLRNSISWEQYGVRLIGTACNGAEALEKIRWYEPDIVITDIQMPVINGLELIRQAKEEGHDCSFIVLSGFDDFQYAQKAIRYGVSDYLLKPILLPELTGILNRLTSEILTRRAFRSEELSTLKDLREAHVAIRKNQLIPELLRAEISKSELDDILLDYGLPLRDDTCTVSLIQLFHPRREAEDEEENPHKLNILKQNLESRLKDRFCIVTQTTDSLLFLLSNVPSNDQIPASFRTLLESYVHDMREEMNVHLFASIGKPTDSLLNLAPSYQTALQALSFHIYEDLGPVIDFSVLDFPLPPSNIPSESSILDTILRGDEDALKEELSLYLAKLHYIPNPPPNYLYSMCNYLIINLKHSLSQHLGKSPTSYTGDTYLALQNLESMNDIHEWMYEILTGFLHELQISRATRSDPLIEKAISYIQENMLGKIHMEDICSHVGLSKSYFSTYFKNKTKLNFRDYILDLKISYAQEQLKFPEHNPSELAILLGYEDYRSFSRAFKLRTGFTPSDYQKKYIQDGN
ncbi:MAG: response regulator [bacterium]|nr:response regulator [bacterium]